MDIKLTDGKTLNVKILKPSFHQAKPAYAEDSNSERTDCRRTQS